MKNKLKYTKKAKVVVIWLLHQDRYVRQYYSERCNRSRDVQVHNLEK